MEFLVICAEMQAYFCVIIIVYKYIWSHTESRSCCRQISQLKLFLMIPKMVISWFITLVALFPHITQFIAPYVVNIKSCLFPYQKSFSKKLYSHILCTHVGLTFSPCLFLSEHQLKRNTPKISWVCPRRCVDTMR